MGKGLLTASCLVLGAAGGLAASLIAGTPPPVEPPPAATDSAPEVSSTDLRRLERRVDLLSSALRAREPDVRVPPESPVEPLDADGADGADGESASAAGEERAAPAGPLLGRVAALEKRVAALESGGARQGPVVPADLGAVASKELDALGRNLVRLKRYDDATGVLDELLGRTDLEFEQRADLELQLGYALRGLGKHAEAEARFVETMRRVGEDTEKGAWAGFQVAWSRYYQKDLTGASARMERSADASGVSPIVRVHSLYNAANFAKQAGDSARARTFLERLLNDHVKDIPQSQAYMRTQAEAWLEELRGY